MAAATLPFYHWLAPKTPSLLVGLLAAILAVSYTHLDVYKRQDQHAVLGDGNIGLHHHVFIHAVRIIKGLQLSLIHI